MKKIRRMGFYLIVFSIVLGACGRKDQADAERLAQMEAAIASLYNEEMNDLAPDISATQLTEVEDSIQTEKENERNEENEDTFQQIESAYNNAAQMYVLETEITDLFTDEIIKDATTQANLDTLTERLAAIDSEKWTSYVDRQQERLAKATEQLEQIQRAQAAVNELYLDGEQVKPEANREEAQRAQEVVAEVQNEAIRLDLNKRLEEVEQVLAEQTAAAKAAKSIGDFAGYYHDEQENFLIIITEDRYEGFVPHSDVFFNYEIVEIIHNSGDEISLVIYHEEVDSGGYLVPEVTAEVEWKLDESGEYIYTEYSKVRRVTAEEFEKLKDPYGYGS